MTITPLSGHGRATDVRLQALQGCMYGEVAWLTVEGGDGRAPNDQEGPKLPKNAVYVSEIVGVLIAIEIQV